MLKRGQYILSRGFTIVELIIAVVVIAILAAITLVAYNGVTHRAEMSKMATAAHYYENALKLYFTDNGDYPLARTSGSVEEFICLGTLAQFPADPAHGFAAGECNYYLHEGNRTTYGQIDAQSEQLFQTLGSYVNGLPKDKLPFSESTSVIPGYHYFDRGFYYTNYNNEYVSLNYDVTSPKCLSEKHVQVNYDTATGQSYCRIIFVNTIDFH